MPSLDDLGTSQVVTEAPNASDFIPFYSVSEFSSSSRVKRSLVSALVSAGITPDAVLDALEGETVEVDGLILADSSSVALEDGVIGWNETLGNFVRHDNSTIGGVAIVPVDPWKSEGSKILLAASLTADAFTELARFPLTSAQAVVGKRYRLSGTYYLGFNGTRPDGCYFGITTEADATTGLSFLYGDSASGTTVKVVQATCSWEFELTDVGGGEYTLGPYAHHTGRATLTGSTSAVEQITEGVGTPVTGQPAGVAQDLILQLQTEATVTAAPVFVVWNLKLEATN